MVWLGACSKGITPLVILDEGIVDHTVYIKKVLPVALKYGNETFGHDWVFQQDGAKPHSHQLSTQQRCRDNFPSFVARIIGLQTVPIGILSIIQFGMNLSIESIGTKSSQKQY